MKILHVVPTLSLSSGGTAKAVLDMATATAQVGHEVFIATTDHGGTTFSKEGALAAGVTISVFPIALPRFWVYSPALKSFLKTAIPEVDLVHLHCQYLFSTVVTTGLCRQYGVPYVFQPHGSCDPFIYKRHRIRKRILELTLQRRLFRDAACVVFTTADEMEIAQGIDSSQATRVIPLGVFPSGNSSTISDARIREAVANRTRGKTVFLFCGRLNFKKGLDILIQAFSFLSRTNTNLHLLIAGPDGGYESSARELVILESLDEKVTFLGQVSDCDVPGLFDKADIFVLPSYSENFGIAVVESLERGLPVIVSDHVNICEEIASYDAGIVCRASVSDLQDAMLSMTFSDSRRIEMGCNAKKLAQDKYSWAAAAATLESLYSEIVHATDH